MTPEQLAEVFERIAADAERSGNLRHGDGDDPDTEDIIAEFARRVVAELRTPPEKEA